MNVELTVDKENKTKMMTQVLHPSKENDLNTKRLGLGKLDETLKYFPKINSLYGYGKIKHEGGGGSVI